VLALARWSTTHRKYVVHTWVLLLLGVNVLAQSAGTSYSNNFTLPASDAQRAADLLDRSFPTQAGDRDTIVFAVRSGSVRDAAVKSRMSAAFATIARLPHVSAVISPYTASTSGRAVSADGRTTTPTTNPYRIAVLQSTNTAGTPVFFLRPGSTSVSPAIPDTRNGASRTKFGSAYPNCQSTIRRTSGAKNQTQSEYWI